MTRYDQPTPMQLAVLASFGRTTSAHPSPITRQVVGERNPTLSPAHLNATLLDLCQGCFLGTMTQTRDGITRDVYWPTGLKPITPPTTEELKIMSTPKNLWLLQTITKHPAQTAAQLSAMADAVGIKIPQKNVSGLLAAYIQSGEVIRDRNESKIFVYLPGATKSAEAKQAAEPAHLLRKIADLEAEIAHLTSAAKADRAELSAVMANEKTERDRATGMEVDLAEICCALHVTNARDALARIAEWTLPIPPVTPELVSTPDQGRLALLVIGENETDLHWLEPYVTDGEGEGLAINQVHCGAARRALLIRALYSATRKIEHGPIAAPAAETLHG